MKRQTMPPKRNPLPSSNSSSDDDTEFVPVDEIPITKTIANLKGRLAGLAKGREKAAAAKNAVKKVKQVTQTINKAQRLQDKATSTLNEGRIKAKEAGLDVPETSPYENQLQQMLSDMRNEIAELKTIKKVPEVPEPPKVADVPLPPPAPKAKVVRKKSAPKPKPAPMSEEYEPRNHITTESPLDTYRGRGNPIQDRQAIYRHNAEIRENEENIRVEMLRQLMGRN